MRLKILVLQNRLSQYYLNLIIIKAAVVANNCRLISFKLIAICKIMIDGNGMFYLCSTECNYLRYQSVLFNSFATSAKVVFLSCVSKAFCAAARCASSAR